MNPLNKQPRNEMTLSGEELVGIRKAVKEIRRHVDETCPSLPRDVKIGIWRYHAQSLIDVAVRRTIGKHGLPEHDASELKGELEYALRKVFEEEFGVDLW